MEKYFLKIKNAIFRPEMGNELFSRVPARHPGITHRPHGTQVFLNPYSMFIGVELIK